MTTDYKNEELLLYIASKLSIAGKNSAVMLNKALYYTDSISYLKTGKPVSSFTYIRQQNGPTPSPAQFMPLREKLIGEEKAEIINAEKYGRIYKIFRAKAAPRIEHLSSEEISFVDGVIGDCIKYNAGEISDISHKEIAWKLAKNFEELPLYTYLLSPEEVTEDDVKWALSEIDGFRPICNN